MFSNNITKPALVISKKKVSENIYRMLAKAKVSGNIFRPHFKTHQSLETGKIFREKGIDKITVSSVEMAEYFASGGWEDITVAFPVNIREIKEINRLAGKIKLNFLVESLYVVKYLESNLTNKINVFIKIDTGYHRTGLSPDSPEIEGITGFLKTADKLNFSGFLTHAGNTYHAKGKEEILKIMSSAGKQLLGLKNRYIKDFPGIITSYGDTPSCSMADDCPGFDEIRPGNFAYYDIMQYHIGSCGLNDIAVAVACPVVSLHPGREEMVVYGGAVHLSKENIEAGDGFKLYGYVVNFTGNGWSNPLPGAYVSNLSQEHGIIKIPEKYLKNYKPGDLVGILPVHSCLTANLLKNQIII